MERERATGLLQGVADGLEAQGMTRVATTIREAALCLCEPPDYYDDGTPGKYGGDPDDGPMRIPEPTAQEGLRAENTKLRNDIKSWWMHLKAYSNATQWELQRRPIQIVVNDMEQALTAKAMETIRPVMQTCGVSPTETAAALKDVLEKICEED